MKKILCLFLVTLLLLIGSKQNQYQINAKDTTNLYNVVLFVDFSDTNHSSHTDSIWGDCFLENPNIEALWNSGPKSLNQYIQKISYGDINVVSIFPQLKDDGKIEPYLLNNTAAYYAEYIDVLVEDAVSKLIDSGKLSLDQLVDGDGDGAVDNVTVVVPCESYNNNTLFTGLHKKFSGSKKLNNKSVWSYNIITESGAYTSNGQSGLVIHEFLHTLGYPDLYRTYGQKVVNPVGVWDIMSSQSTYVQLPLAYQRQKIHQNFTIPVVTTNQTSYKLYSTVSTLNNGINKDNQAVIIKADGSDSEFFVVEYRQKAAQYINNKPNDNAYERMIYGSGLIIYRVNTDQLTNHSNDEYYIYVFRPGETSDNNSYGDGYGNIYESFLSLESGRTSYGSSLPTATISDGAITYSDGTNSGIVISNVSSASGDNISFDITFNNIEGSDYWKTVSTSTHSGSLLSSTNIGDDLYFALSWGDNKLLKYSNSSWSELANLPNGSGMKIINYKNDIYCAYTDSLSTKFYFSKYNNGSFDKILEENASTNFDNIALTVDNDSLYFSYINTGEYGYGIGVKTYQYTTNGGVVAIPPLTINGNIISLSAENGKIALAYREVSSPCKIHIQLYSGGSWSEITNSYNANTPNISLKNNHIVVNTENQDSTISFYDYDIANQTWSKLGSDLPGTGSTGVSYLYPNGDLYIVYSHGGDSDTAAVYYLKNNVWTIVGKNLESTSVATHIQGLLSNNTLYSCYVKNYQIVIKKHNVESATSGSEKEISYTIKHLCGNATLYEKTYTSKIKTNESNPQVMIQDGSLNIATYQNYQFESMNPLLSEGDFVDNGTTIALNYKEKTNTPSKKDVSYTVKHVYNNNVLYQKTYTENVLATQNNIKIQNGSLNIVSYNDYQYSNISPNVKEGDYVDDKTIITLTYVAKQVNLTITLRRLDVAEKIYVDGRLKSSTSDANNSYVQLDNQNNKIVVISKFNTATETDIHKIYPTSMEVYRVSIENYQAKLTKMDDFTNILKYAGTSIKIGQDNGIRIITGISKTNKEKLISNTGLGGYQLLEYGTVACWASKQTGGQEPVIGDASVASPVAYKRGSKDPIYRYSGNDMQYTNILLLSNIKNDQYDDDFAMRPYMKLKNLSTNEEIVIYGATVYRSIGYVALQNKNAFQKGSAPYQYTWNMIRYAYPSVYESEYGK